MDEPERARASEQILGALVVVSKSTRCQGQERHSDYFETARGSSKHRRLKSVVRFSSATTDGQKGVHVPTEEKRVDKDDRPWEAP